MNSRELAKFNRVLLQVQEAYIQGRGSVSATDVQSNLARQTRISPLKAENTFPSTQIVRYLETAFRMRRVMRVSDGEERRYIYVESQ